MFAMSKSLLMWRLDLWWKSLPLVSPRRLVSLIEGALQEVLRLFVFAWPLVTPVWVAGTSLYCDLGCTLSMELFCLLRPASASPAHPVLTG